MVRLNTESPRGDKIYMCVCVCVCVWTFEI